MSAHVPLKDVVQSKYFPTFDGIRTLGIALLLCGHASYPVAGLPGDLGVSAFFVLSGFLITRLLLREREETGTISLRAFYARRTLRIFPAYYAYILVSFAIDWVKHDRWSPGVIASAFGYLMNYYNAFNNHPGTELAHTWSLAVEEQFYLLWPLAFMLLAKRGKRSLILALITSTVVVIAWRSYLYLGRGVGSAYAYNAFDCRFDNLAVGCLLAVIIDYPRVLAIGVSLARRAWYPVLTLVLLVAVRLLPPHQFRYSIGFTVYAVLLAVFFVQLLQLYKSPLWSWIELPAVRYIGGISYPMYLWHSWAGSVGRHFPGESRHVEFFVEVIATILLGTGSFFVLEKPFLRLKHRFVARQRARQAVLAPGVLATDAVLAPSRGATPSAVT